MEIVIPFDFKLTAGLWYITEWTKLKGAHSLGNATFPRHGHILVLFPIDYADSYIFPSLYYPNQLNMCIPSMLMEAIHGYLVSRGK